MLLSLNGKNLKIVEPEIRGSEREPSLLFIHGAGCNASVWKEQSNYFTGKHLAYLMDLPGHGGSSPEGEDRILSYTECVRLTASSLFSSRPFVLVGHSMGGAVALEMGIHPPKNLAGMVLVGTGSRLTVTRAIFQMIREDLDVFFQTITQFAFAPGATREVRENFIHAVRDCRPTVLFNDFKACDSFDVRDRLEKIHLPVLILCGAEDQLTPTKYSAYLHEKIEASRLVIVPQAGHLVMAEQPEIMNEAVESFLRELCDGRQGQS
jgi:pimeloyl-ACP methyl ester carboxylesterase